MGVSTFLYETMGSFENYNSIKQWFRNYVSIKTAVSIGNVTTALQVLIDRPVEFSYSLLKTWIDELLQPINFKREFFLAQIMLPINVKQSEIIDH